MSTCTLFTLGCGTRTNRRLRLVLVWGFHFFFFAFDSACNISCHLILLPLHRVHVQLPKIILEPDMFFHPRELLLPDVVNEGDNSLVMGSVDRHQIYRQGY